MKHFLGQKFLLATVSALLFAACGDDDSDFFSHADSSMSMSTVTDARDNQTYKTVKIGKQWWMAENLNYEAPNSYCYNDEDSYCAKYGRLYTWAVAMDSAGLLSTDGLGCGNGEYCSPNLPVRGVCPEGWHLPSADEFEILINAVSDPDSAGWALKSKTGWRYTERNTDEFSFTALAAGFRFDNGEFLYEGEFTEFWSIAEYHPNMAKAMYLSYSYGDVYLTADHKYNAASVRCIKN